MKLAKYLQHHDTVIQSDQNQQKWLSLVMDRIKQNKQLINDLSQEQIQTCYHGFQERIRTEEIKAWYSSPNENDLFQGTSVTSLTIPSSFEEAQSILNIEQLENLIADEYIKKHNQYSEIVKDAIVDDVDEWLREGLFYGISIASKVISQAFELTANEQDIVFEVDHIKVDPHEIFSYEENSRKQYFDQALSKIDCFEGLNVNQEEFESSLILGDISKPNLKKYRSKILLAPIRCNEIASMMAKNIKKLITNKTNSKISPRSLMVTIYDTDTPYTYHQLLGHHGSLLAPVLPGLTVLGASGTIDAFKWLYSYRVSLVTQKIQKGSLYGEVHKKHTPFVFYGVLVPRDAEILLDLNSLDLLRYKGNLSPLIEYLYIFEKLYDYYKIKSDSNDLRMDYVYNRLL